MLTLKNPFKRAETQAPSRAWAPSLKKVILRRAPGVVRRVPRNSHYDSSCPGRAHLRARPGARSGGPGGPSAPAGGRGGLRRWVPAAPTWGARPGARSGGPGDPSAGQMNFSSVEKKVTCTAPRPEAGAAEAATSRRPTGVRGRKQSPQARLPAAGHLCAPQCTPRGGGCHVHLHLGHKGPLVRPARGCALKADQPDYRLSTVASSGRATVL